MPSECWYLLANFGGEECRPVDLDQPNYRRLARLWSLLFQPPIRWITPEPSTHASDLLAHAADSLGLVAKRPTGSSWLPTVSSHQSINQRGLTDAGPLPAIVRRCHDKDFALLGPRPQEPIGFCSRTFDPTELVDMESILVRIRDTVAAWPVWAQVDWTLKPRFGSSGRGRIAGKGLDIDAHGLRGSLPRLIEQGGFILQPFCRERIDLSVQLDVPANSSLPVHVLGSLRPIVTMSGSYQGHRGVIREGSASSDHAFDSDLREQAIALAQAARTLGFFGPCGVDAFAYVHDGKPYLHLCEFNARWTVGHVVHGIVRRLATRLDFLADGFEFRLDEPIVDGDGRSILLTSLDKGTAAIIKPWSS